MCAGKKAFMIKFEKRYSQGLKDIYRLPFLSNQTFFKMKGGERVMKWLSKFVKEDSGATAVEYGIMVAAIAAVIITIVISVGAKTNTAFNKIDTELDNVK